MAIIDNIVEDEASFIPLTQIAKVDYEEYLNAVKIFSTSGQEMPIQFHTPGEAKAEYEKIKTEINLLIKRKKIE